MKETAYRQRIKRGLSIGQAARILGVPVVTLRSWMNKGLVPGVLVTQGGHRWLTRQALFAFAEKKGLRPAAEKRRHKRVHVWRNRVRVRATLGDQVVVEGEGRLRDISRGGFRTDRITWRTPFTPAKGALIRFEVPGTQGRLTGISGSAKVAWHYDNRAGRGASLGARIETMHDERRAWAAYLKVEVN